jgi:phosphoribosylamine--glycine ligase
MRQCLLLGNGGREAVLAENLSKGYELYSILPYENPSIVEAVTKSKGKYIVGSPFDKELVEKFIKQEEIELCFVSSDALLQDGLIDLAKKLGLKVFGPTSKGAKIEWSKTYALDVVKELAPEMIIKNFNISSIAELEEAINNYSNDEFVVKPEGLTGGKGVKVGGIHFKGKEEGFEYAKSCLESSSKVIIQDKVEGAEFTVMALTDGENIVVTPVIFDYPYRYDEDKGPGTGGMGCISFGNGLLPFLDKQDVDKCAELIKKTIGYMNKDSLEFTGVIYGGFFKCKDEIKFIEFNARFGDGEVINLLNLLGTPFTEVVDSIIDKKLSNDTCKFLDKYSFMVYIVTPEYAVTEAKAPCEFELNKEGLKADGVNLYFANAKHTEANKYVSVSNSRLFAVEKTGDNLEDLKKEVYESISKNVDKKLDYRKDIGNIYIH